MLTYALDLPKLASRYHQAAADLHRAAAAFEDGARLLDERRLDRAEEMLRRGLDRLETVVIEMPKAE